MDPPINKFDNQNERMDEQIEKIECIHAHIENHDAQIDKKTEK